MYQGYYMQTLNRVIFLFIFSFITLFSATHTWTGEWHVSWSSGAFVLQIEEYGSDINGTFEPGEGTLAGKVLGNSVKAITTTKSGQTGHLTLTMGESGKSFFGRDRLDDWVSGVRVGEDRAYNALTSDQSSRMNVFYSFLMLGNSVRNSNYGALEKALDIIAFSDAEKKMPHAVRLLMAKTFYQVLDQCIVKKIDFVRQTQDRNNTVTLEQIGGDVKVFVSFVQDKKTKKWKISIGKLPALDRKLKALLKVRGLYEVDPKDNLQLKDPRATMRTFTEEYNRWKRGGKPYVVSTMNLSLLDPAIHEWQAPLLAYYLKSVLDRIGKIVFQEIPNDNKNKKPYIYFRHHSGNIIIAPYEIDGKTKWQFTPETLATIDNLYNEMIHVKPYRQTKIIKENNLYFHLKDIAKNISPLLLNKLYYTEYWQILMLILIIILGLFVCFLLRNVMLYLFRHFTLTKRWTTEMVTLRYIRPMQIVTFGLIFLYGAHQLGLSNLLFSTIKGFTQLLVVIGMTWILYNLISMLFLALQIHARKTSTNIDEIIFSLSGSILRILLITVSLFLIAEIFKIPYKTVLAGLGIGGLAFAIAAKDTIANFFGSAIIIADRPFQTGDKVKIDSDVGVITNVGIRSTKIRTTKDTLLTVPNNMITHKVIDNFSARKAMRMDTSFFLGLDTSKVLLDTLDTAITSYLKAHKDVEQDKIILTGVNDYTKRGILFEVTCFVKATKETAYSDIRHHLVTELADIIKEHNIELVKITQEDEADA